MCEMEVNGYKRSEIYDALLTEIANGVLKGTVYEAGFATAILVEMALMYTERKEAEGGKGDD